MELGNQIKAHRAALSLSQEELAEKVYVTRQTVSNWETGKSYPDIHSLLLPSALFDVSLDQLIKGDLETMKQEVNAAEVKAMNRDAIKMLAMFTMLLVGALGGDSERAGFRWVALIVSVLFVVTELVCCAAMRETTPSEMKTATVKEMFSALFRNDQAMVVVGSIVLINSALYLTSNFIIYFFKYDLGGAGWKATYTLFSTVGGAAQILGMMVLYPLLRKKFSSTQVFHLSLVLALCGYGTLLVFCLTGLSHSLALLCIPGVVVFACNGMLTVLTTLFLSNSVDYGQLKTGRREESVIFSMQTFVVKAASGVAVFLTGIGLDLIGLVGNTEETGPVAVQSAGTLLGLRLMMTVLPMLVLAGALVLFRRKFVLTDARAAEISAQLDARMEKLQKIAAQATEGKDRALSS